MNFYYYICEKSVMKQEMENQQLSIKKRYDIGDRVGIYTILSLDSKKCRLLCNNCGEEKEVTRNYLSSLKDSEYCSKCKPKYSRKYKIGDVIGNVYELQEFLGGDKWKVKCTQCGKIQEQSMSNMKVHKKETCTYCNYPNYSPTTHKGGGGSVKLAFDERFYNYYKSRVDGWNKSPNRKFKEWKLSIEDVSKLIHDNCYYCGAEPSANNQWNKSCKRKTEDNIIKINGIDRLDSDKGYIPSNCVSCCPICNHMKNDLSIEEFKLHIKILYHNFFDKSSTTIM